MQPYFNEDSDHSIEETHVDTNFTKSTLFEGGNQLYDSPVITSIRCTSEHLHPNARNRRTTYLEPLQQQRSQLDRFVVGGKTTTTNSTTTTTYNDSTARDQVLRYCGQAGPLNFDDIYSESTLRQCRKIGEGVYGEVFMSKSPTTGQAIVFKIIPIEGDIEVNGERQKNYREILPEIIISLKLSELRAGADYATSGFVDVKNIRCVQGCYPAYLLELWELYRENNGTENDCPDIFNDDQLFIVLELANSGQDLEAFQFNNALQAYSTLQQVALTLAVAEEKYQFEHRDLHWGNILLSHTDEQTIQYRFPDKLITIATHGIRATIIDFTLSRLVVDNKCVLYNDLANDEELFSAGGDYQFDIYRLMRTNLNNVWDSFVPYTNVLWLHYIVDKLINGARYKYSKTRKHRTALTNLMIARDSLLAFDSANTAAKSL